MLCRNRHVLRLPQTATRCACVLIRAQSTKTAKATDPANVGDDARKPARTKRADDGNKESTKKFRSRKPMYDSEGNLVPEGWTIDTKTKQVRRIKKRSSQEGDEEASVLSNLLHGSDIEIPESTSPPFVKDRVTGEWRLRKSKHGTTVKSLKEAAPELLEALEHAKIKKQEERAAKRRQKAQEEEERSARRRARQAAQEQKEKELELKRLAKIEAQKQREVEEQALKDARAAAKLAAAQRQGKLQGTIPRRKTDPNKTPEEKLAEKAEKARIRNRLHRRKVRAEEKKVREAAKAEAKKQKEAESAMAQLERISRETSEAKDKDLSGAQSKIATKKLDIAKRTDKTRRTRRTTSESQLKSDLLLARNPTRAASGIVNDQSKSMSERLEAVAPWKANPARARGKAPRHLKDYNRVNIISENLCDDIINYMGKDLDRHVGCDLLDLNPGVGVWSKKLNERLQPRKHIMLEGDADMYQPFMGDFLKKPNVHLINSTPWLWTELEKQLAEHLTEQKIQRSGTPKERNDTLLVTANIAWWPSQMLYKGSMGLMIAYQLIQSIHSSTLFQKYGNVRMLLWVDDQTKSRMVPRQMHGRRVFAFTAELGTEWINEIAGPEAIPKASDRVQVRDLWVDFESNALAHLRMKAARREMPAHRIPQHHQEVLNSPELIGERLAGVRAPMFRRSWYNDLAKLNTATSEELAANEKAKFQMVYLKRRSEREDWETQCHLEAIQTYERAMATYGTPEGKAHIDELVRMTNSWPKGQSTAFETVFDDYRLFRNPSGPLLTWDKRQMEPLRVDPHEYFPNVPMSLLDIQPKTMAPALQQYGRLSTRSGDMSDLLLRAWLTSGKTPPHEAMATIWHGFAEQDILDKCPSFTDPKKGGVPLEFGHSACHRVRTTTEEQWLEVLQAWMEWPFRPTYVEMVGKSVEESAVTAMAADD